MLTLDGALYRHATEMRGRATSEQDKTQADNFLRILTNGADPGDFPAYALGSLWDGAGDRFARAATLPAQEENLFKPGEGRLFVFENARLFSSGVIAAQDSAIEEFTFASQPNWRGLGIPAYAAADIHGYDEETAKLYLRRCENPQTIAGPVFWTGSAWTLPNFGHFVHDFLSQLFYIDQAKALFGEHFSVFMPSVAATDFRHPMQRFLFDTLIGPSANLLTLEKGACAQVGQLIAGNPSFCLRGGNRAMVSSGAIRYLNRRVRERFADLADPNAPRKIYITRDDGIAARNIENETSIRARLIAAGFTPVTVSRHTPTEIITLFYNAEQIAGAHGAGLMNLVFADPTKLRVIEMQLYPSNWNSIRMFAQASGIDIVAIPATQGVVAGSCGIVDDAALEAALAP